MRRTPYELLPACGLFAVLACSKPTSEPTSSQPTSSRANVSADSAPVAEARPPKLSAVTAADGGRQLYERYCRLCHGEGAKGYAADNAPSLVSKSFLESATDGFITKAVAVGRPNTAMAAYSKERGGPLSDPQISAIVEYIRSLGPPAALKLTEGPAQGDPTAGERLFATHCQKCHGTASERGNALSLHNPELLAAATPAFLRHAIVNGRQATPMPAFSGLLSEQQIADIISHLRSFAPKQSAAPVRDKQVPDDLPPVIHPKGAAPKFSLRAGRFVSAAQVNEALRQRRRMVIVDARSPADWIQYRIPGSIPIAYYDTESLSRIPNDGTWVIAYCACPHHASGMVIDALRQRGYKHTAVLDEGILFWRKQGYPVEGEAVASDEGASGKDSVPPRAP